MDDDNVDPSIEDKLLMGASESYQTSVPEVTSEPIEQMTLLAAMDAAMDSTEMEDVPTGSIL